MSESLTEREKDLLILVAEGADNAEVAEAMGVSPLTVKSHLQRISVKLGTRNRTHAVVTAIRNGDIE